MATLGRPRLPRPKCVECGGDLTLSQKTDVCQACRSAAALLRRTCIECGGERRRMTTAQGRGRCMDCWRRVSAARPKSKRTIRTPGPRPEREPRARAPRTQPVVYEDGSMDCRTCGTRTPPEKLVTKKGVAEAWCHDCRYAYQAQWRYGITPEEYAARLAEQGGACAICKRVPDRRLVVDHDHATQAVRALLCQPCNKGLGNFEDDTERMLAAISYLRDFS